MTTTVDILVKIDSLSFENNGNHKVATFTLYPNLPGFEYLAYYSVGGVGIDYTGEDEDVENGLYSSFEAAIADKAIEGIPIIINALNYNDNNNSYTAGNIVYIPYYLDAAINAKYDIPTPGAHVADAATNAATDAPTDLNILTTLIGTLTGEVNSTNAKYNDLAAKHNDLATKFNTVLDRLEALTLLAAS